MKIVIIRLLPLIDFLAVTSKQDLRKSWIRNNPKRKGYPVAALFSFGQNSPKFFTYKK
jgi:hypothetical protein